MTVSPISGSAQQTIAMRLVVTRLSVGLLAVGLNACVVMSNAALRPQRPYGLLGSESPGHLSHNFLALRDFV